MTSRRRWLAVAAVVLALGAGGCGSASPSAPPAGVDGLVIPTPDPDPGDFVADVDNPWFPLHPGTTWTYDAEPLTPEPTLTVVVEAGPEVDGVATTSLVRTAGADGADGARGAGRVTRDHYAQDRDGNVWWFGREGVWQAGTSGARAGLAMPATPRVGDGFRQGSASGLTVIARVEDVDTTVEVPVGTYQQVVVLEVTDGTTTRKEYYAHGTGLVRADEAGLVGFDQSR